MVLELPGRRKGALRLSITVRASLRRKGAAGNLPGHGLCGAAPLHEPMYRVGG